VRETRPICGLCGELKENIRDIGSTHIWLCLHCDTTVNCKDRQAGIVGKCGQCALARAKKYPGLPEVVDLSGQPKFYDHEPPEQPDPPKEEEDDV
jgi:hypothetical protein